MMSGMTSAVPLFSTAPAFLFRVVLLHTQISFVACPPYFWKKKNIKTVLPCGGMLLYYTLAMVLVGAVGDLTVQMMIRGRPLRDMI